MNREALKAQLRIDEGLRLKPYGDLKSKISIGFGRNLTDVGITRVEAEAMLDRDVDRTLMDLLAAWPTFGSVDDVRQQVIANMAYNLGVAGLMMFRHTLAAIARGEYTNAAQQMRDSLWAEQTGPRAERLAIAMETGAFPT